jgi:hypothetical protein
VGLFGGRKGKQARRFVLDEAGAEPIVAEGTVAFMFTDGVQTVWPEVHIGITESRLLWAMVRHPDPVMSMTFGRMVRLEQPMGQLFLTERNPEFADSSNPHGETDALFTFGDDPASSRLREIIVEKAKAGLNR